MQRFKDIIGTRLHLAALELSPTGMLAVGRNGEILVVNAEICRMFGYLREELIGAPLELLVPARFQPHHIAHRDAYFTAPETQPMGQGRQLHGQRRDGSEFPIEVGLNVIKTEGSSVVVASVVDISLRLRAEVRFQAAFESALNGLLMVDEAGVIQKANQAAEALFGYEQGALVGLPVSALVPENIRAAHPGYQQNFMKDATERRMGSGRDLFGVRKDGSEVPVEIGLKPITTDEGCWILTTIVDITARKQLEQQLRSTQRTEILGTLANGIAHDFNNILQAIITVSEATMGESPDEETREAFSTIVQASSRGREMVRRILTFSRNLELPRQPIQPNESILEVAEFLRASLPSNIQMRLDIDATCPRIQSDPTLFFQVVMNLATNAIQAMPGGGTLTIRTRGRSIAQTLFKEEQVIAPGFYMSLVVEDTGYGMSQEVARRAFDPFFTTKPPGQGSGLGLAVVKGIVDSHDARISTTVLAPGTRFELLFPAVKRKAPDAPNLDESAPALMLVDDEVMIGTWLERYLRRRGCRATFFPSAIEALEALDEEPWKLIITDNAMPHMNGLEFIEALRERGHQTRVWMMTGHLPPSDERCARLDIERVLCKPVGLDELWSQVQEAINAPT